MLADLNHDYSLDTIIGYSIDSDDAQPKYYPNTINIVIVK